MGRYLDIIRQAEEAHKLMGESTLPSTPPDGQGRSLGVRIPEPAEQEASPTLGPGSLITWRGQDEQTRGPGTVDSLHTDPDGTVWAFVSLPDELWTMINLHYAKAQCILGYPAHE